MEPVRILIADDHPHFRDGLRALLLSAPAVEVVGEARDGDEVIELAARLQPDVILMVDLPRYSRHVSVTQHHSGELENVSGHVRRPWVSKA